MVTWRNLSSADNLYVEVSVNPHPAKQHAQQRLEMPAVHLPSKLLFLTLTEYLLYI